MQKFGEKNGLSIGVRCRILSALAIALLIPACVTINIYFPAAAAEKAADKIIDDVWQLKPGETAPVQPSATPAK